VQTIRRWSSSVMPAVVIQQKPTGMAGVHVYKSQLMLCRRCAKA